jgi:hypothetical protein
VTRTLVCSKTQHDSPHAYQEDSGSLHGPLGNEASPLPLGTATAVAVLQAHWSGWAITQGNIEAGTYYPRVWRGSAATEVIGQASPPADDLAVFASLEQLDVLTSELDALFRVCAPDVNTHHVYGTRIRQLLALACMEVEAQWSAILKANNAVLPQRPSTNDYVKLLVPLRLRDFEIKLRKHPTYPAQRPFGNWNATSPTATLPWYDAYNKTKHDRESHFTSATLEHVIASVCAVAVMACAQFGPHALFGLSARPTLVVSSLPKWAPEDRYYPPRTGQVWQANLYQF